MTAHDPCSPSPRSRGGHAGVPVRAGQGALCGVVRCALGVAAECLGKAETPLGGRGKTLGKGRGKGEAGAARSRQDSRQRGGRR